MSAPLWSSLEGCLRHCRVKLSASFLGVSQGIHASFSLWTQRNYFLTYPPGLRFPPSHFHVAAVLKPKMSIRHIGLDFFSWDLFSPCCSFIWLFTDQRLHWPTSMYLPTPSQVLYKKQLQKERWLYWVFFIAARPGQPTMRPLEGEILEKRMALLWMPHL